MSGSASLLTRAQKAVGVARYTRGALGTTADTLTVLTFVGSAVVLASGTPLPEAVLATYVSVLSLLLLVLLLRLEARLGRRARQSDAMPDFATSMATLSQANYDLLKGGAPETFVARLEAATKELATSYGVATGVPCRITVKLIGEASQRMRLGFLDFSVKTLCRSGGQAGGQPEGGVDLIGDNTDFRDLLERDADHYACNDIPAAISSGYRNSHFTPEMIKSDTFPYRSTIVWPVRAQLTSDTADPKWAVRGFLCLDSRGARAFDESIDVSPGEAFAHALYSGLSEYREHTEATAQRAPAKMPDRQDM